MSSISISARRKARKKAKAEAAINKPAVIERAAELFSGKRPTPYAIEGWFVETVRRNRVLAGMPFNDADESARELALAALKRIGWSVRPVDSDAGPIRTGTKSCQVCGEDYIFIHTGWSDRYSYLKFCSFECLHKSESNYKRAEEMVACEHCDKEFRPFTKERNASSDQRFCSQDCYRAAMAERKPEPKTCEYCAETFQPRQPSQRWCSDVCYNAARTVLHDPKKCEGCGESFIPKVGLRGETQKFCSAQCYKIKNPGNEDRNCQVCRTLFTPARGERGRKQKFCGRDCYQTWRAQTANTFSCEAA